MEGEVKEHKARIRRGCVAATKLCIQPLGV